MNKKISLVAINLVIFCAYSYSQPKLLTIDLEKGIENDGSVTLSTIASTIEYIPIETNARCLLGQSLRIRLEGQNIFIATDMKHLYRFSRDGKFLNEVGKMGRGPGEFVQVVSYIVNAKEKKIYVNDALFGNKIIAYDYQGKYLDHFPVKTASMVMELFANEHLMIQNMYSDWPEKGKRKNEIEIYNTKGKLVNAILSTVSSTARPGLSFIPSIIYNFNHISYYKAPSCDTMFQIPGLKGKIPYYYFKMGTKKRSGDANELSGYKTKNTVAIMDIHESDNLLFITCTGDKNRQNILFNKKSSETTNLKVENSTGIEEDIMGGMPFWPYLYSGSEDQKHVVDWIFAHELIKRTESELFNKKCKTLQGAKNLKKAVENISADDNQIIRIVTLK